MRVLVQFPVDFGDDMSFEEAVGFVNNGLSTISCYGATITRVEKDGRGAAGGDVYGVLLDDQRSIAHELPGPPQRAVGPGGTMSRFIVDINEVTAPVSDRHHLMALLTSVPWVDITRAEKDGREGDTQPMPTITDGQDIQSMVIADITARREVGIQRYGTALQANNGRDAMRDLYDELLDACCYAKQALVERDQMRNEDPL